MRKSIQSLFRRDKDKDPQAVSKPDLISNQKQEAVTSRVSLLSTGVDGFKRIENVADFVSSLRNLKSAPCAEFAFNKSNYHFTRSLGRGSYATVKQAIKLDEGLNVAVKEIQKTRMQDHVERLKEEIEILQSIDHPNLLRLIDWGFGKLTIYLVTELAPGGELFDKIIESGKFYETDAATIIGTLLDALSYLHERKIVHRDLKPENIFLRDPEKKDFTSIVIGDFGISRILNDDVKFLKTRIGSGGYIAPEVLMQRRYGTAVDMWSIGVIAYILLTGMMPYKGNNFDAELEKILRDKPDYDARTWNEVSSSAREFVENCLVVDPASRLSSIDGLKHPWITTYGPAKFRVEKRTPTALRSTNLFSMVREGLDLEKMRISNIINLHSSPSHGSISSMGSNATSGFGDSRSSSRKSSYTNLNEMDIDPNTSTHSIIDPPASNLMVTGDDD